MTNISGMGSPRPSSIIVIGSFPPRRCGIATFTHDTVVALRSADPEMEVSVIALDDGSGAPATDGSVIGTLKQHDLASYVEAASLINDQAPDCVIVQHEFGIFGGPAGEFLLTLLSLMKVPVVTILHTVLEQPDYNHVRVMRRLIHRSAKLVVMAQRGAEMLRDVYGATAEKVCVIPHGAPERPYAEPAEMRRKLGLSCGPMISTFGLLSPNKGIENVIEAMPQIVALYPSVKYVVLGATHPHLIAREGEAYRHSLEALVERLSVAENVQFINKFVANEELFDYLQASDIYVTPYLNEAQITSGTLSYALAMGSYVVSTPYWHAQEVFRECPGTVVPIGDSAAIRDAFADTLGDAGELSKRRKAVHAWAQQTTWSRFGDKMLKVTNEAVRTGKRVPHISERHGPAYPGIALKAIERMTDDCGIVQHSRFAIPDRRYGYCVDDNARALILTNEIIRRGMIGPDIERQHNIYAAFVMHAFDPADSGFRNFMGYDRRWSASAASEDSQGRTFWSLGHSAATSQYEGNHGWAATLLQRCIANIEAISSPRAKAFVMLGCAELVESESRDERYTQLLLRFANELAEQFRGCRGPGWEWLEDTLSYDNARIPQALMLAAKLENSDELVNVALRALDWLCDIQLVDHGTFAPVGSESFNRVRLPPLPFDQQPLEAAAMLDACYQAFLATSNPIWWRRAKTIFSWFYGLNSHDTSLVNPVTGHCHDGLNRSGLNLNSGAESLLAFQMSVCTYQSFLAKIDATPLSRELSDTRQSNRR